MILMIKETEIMIETTNTHNTSDLSMKCTNKMTEISQIMVINIFMWIKKIFPNKELQVTQVVSAVLT
jgi:hypothetical protein